MFRGDSKGSPRSSLRAGEREDGRSSRAVAYSPDASCGGSSSRKAPDGDGTSSAGSGVNPSDAARFAQSAGGFADLGRSAGAAEGNWITSGGGGAGSSVAAGVSTASASMTSESGGTSAPISLAKLNQWFFFGRSVDMPCLGERLRRQGARWRRDFETLARPRMQSRQYSGIANCCEVLMSFRLAPTDGNQASGRNDRDWQSSWPIPRNNRHSRRKHPI
jgi:hypothetical protein